MIVLWPSTSDAALAGLRSDRDRQAERQRRERMAARWALLSGDFRELVRAEVRRIFVKPEQANRVSITGDTSLNVFRFVCEELFAYQGARRAFKVPQVEQGDGGPVTVMVADPVYQRLERDVVPFDVHMAEVYLAAGAYNDVLVRVLPGLPATLLGGGTEVGPPRIRVFLPHEVTVVADPDEPERPLEVRYEVAHPEPSRAGDTVTEVWNAREHYLLDGRRVLVPADQDGIANPWGVLPFFAVHRGTRADTFWDSSTGEDQVQFTLQFLAAWSSIHHLLHQQGYKQIVRNVVDQNAEPIAAWGPGVEIQIPNGEQINVLDLQSDPAAARETLRNYLSQHLAQFGISGERLGMNPGQAPPSGLARYMERQPLLERRRKHKPWLVEAEYDLAHFFRWAWNLNHAEQIDARATFEVEVLEESMVLSPIEREDMRLKTIERLRAERELGLRDEASQFAEYNGVTREEALVALASLSPQDGASPAPGGGE